VLADRCLGRSYERLIRRRGERRGRSGKHEVAAGDIEEKFGVRLRQLNAPPADLRLWVAAIRTGEDRGHAVVGRGLTIVYDPVSDGQGRWGQHLPRSFGYEVDGFELVEAS
jgi:hypothetical protein